MGFLGEETGEPQKKFLMIWSILELRALGKLMQDEVYGGMVLSTKFMSTRRTALERSFDFQDARR